MIDEPVTNLQGSERFVRLQAVCPAFSPELQTKAIPKLTSAGLQIDVLNGIETVSIPESQPVGKVLATLPVVVALNENERAMAKLGYALHKEEVFKKVLLQSLL